MTHFDKYFNFIIENFYYVIVEVNGRTEKSSDSSNFVADFPPHPCYYMFMTKIKIKGH